MNKESISIDQLNKIRASKKGISKYRNKRTQADGIWFDSKAESMRYLYNKQRIVTGQLGKQELQVAFELHAGIKYVCDFVEHYPDGRVEVVDVKGSLTDVFRLKKKLFEDKYAPTKIMCVKYKNKRWELLNV